MLKILIVGATSAIAHETARCFAADGAELFLVGRSEAKLATLEDDLKARGAKNTATYAVDLTELDKHPAMIEAAIKAFNGLDAVLIAHGTLGDQEASQKSVELTLQELNTNFLSIVSILTILGNYFEEQKRGSIAVISSVAGDRGRQSNYIYGTAKGGVNRFLQGLRNRLSKSGVNVLTVKPGFVDTPMTADVKKNFLFAKPSQVGKVIYESMKKGKDVVYVPWFWRPIMLLISNIPEFIFKKMSM